ncbi:hypothetical protein KIW84_012773 [Lathyrus oleraceus]|uniref:Uncharacterized protein n=1 Tax=Pisum sativum TaxID=3888 RepID=A0A9D5GWT3_PEA|nr:hypothetical protein KIW84_012773 [Pisum sativum]
MIINLRLNPPINRDIEWLSSILVYSTSFGRRLGYNSPQCPKPKKENQSGGKVFALSGSETSADDRLIRGT